MVSTAGRSHDHPVRLEGHHVKTILNESCPRQGTRVIQKTVRGPAGLSADSIPDHHVQILEVRIGPDPEATSDIEIDPAATIVEVQPGVMSVLEVALSAKPRSQESAV